MVSFVSANYLSFDLPCTCDSASFGRRRGLGLPSPLALDGETTKLETELAGWLEQPCAQVRKSTLHALLDLADYVGTRRGLLLIDERAYALSAFAARTARAAGARLATVGRGRVDDLTRALRRERRRPAFFLCDGWSWSHGLTPLGELAAICEAEDAQLVVDDTQAIGILGRRAGSSSPHGSRGNGTLQYFGVSSHNGVVVASLAKAFGVSLALIAGPCRLLHQLRHDGELCHASSPPDLPQVRAARRVLGLNLTHGEESRLRMRSAVRSLCAAIPVRGTPYFPLQSWWFSKYVDASRTWSHLYERGVWTLLRRQERRGVIHFLVTASHDGPAMARALSVVREVPTRW
jgi:8-amino-7-oxononanoate synthase